MAGCPHEGLRLVLPEEDPILAERNRRPFTCDDCGGPELARFTHAQVTMLLWGRLKEKSHATAKR